LDTVIFNYQLTRSIGWLGTFGLGVNYIVTAKLLRAVTPSFGKLAAIEAKLEASQIGNGVEDDSFTNARLSLRVISAMLTLD
jgi:hypothetical protein